MKNTFIDGKSVYLRPLEKADIEGNYRYWFNDKDVTKYNAHGRFPHYYEHNMEYYEKTRLSFNDVVLAIIDKNTNEHVGNISLGSINWIDRNAEISIIIGEKKAWGKGYAKEAWNLLIDHGFKSLNLHRIYCGTQSKNKSMQKVIVGSGMEEEGRFKEGIYKDGEYNDIILYSIINNKL